MVEHAYAHGEATGIRATSGSDRFTGCSTPVELAQRTLEELTGLVRVDSASIVLIGDDGNHRTLATLPPSDPQHVRNPAATPRRRLTPIRSGTIVSLPLEHQDRTFGMLSFAPAPDDPFPPPARRACRRLVGHLATELADSLRSTGPDDAEVERRVRERTADLEARVADLEKQNARLLELNGDLRALVHSVTHDLLSPVRTIRSAAYALMCTARPLLDPAAREHARRVEETSQHLGRLVDGLTAYSRTGGVQPEHRLPLDLREVVDEALAQLGEEIERAGAEVTVAGPMPSVLGHHAILVQATMNLVANALKFVPPGAPPRVRIGGRILENEGRLEVSDRGIGIAGRDLVRVFRLFERLHGADAYPGSGLGLAIVQRSITRLGGRVGVESVPGEGSTFWVALPLAP